MKVRVGDKVKLPNERRRYTVQARDERFIICTKKFNLQHTVLYFIVDLKEHRRGSDNMVFCSGYETILQCKERLEELEQGKIEISRRYGIDLDIDIE